MGDPVPKHRVPTQTSDLHMTLFSSDPQLDNKEWGERGVEAWSARSEMGGLYHNPPFTAGSVIDAGEGGRKLLRARQE